MTDDLPRWGAHVSQRLDALASGDGRDAWEPGREWPGPAIIALARDLARAAFPPDAPEPSVIPAADGGISFEWHAGGLDVDVDIDPEGHAEAWLCDRAAEYSRILDLADDDGVADLRTVLSELGEAVTP